MLKITNRCYLPTLIIISHMQDRYTYAIVSVKALVRRMTSIPVRLGRVNILCLASNTPILHNQKVFWAEFSTFYIDFYSIKRNWSVYYWRHTSNCERFSTALQEATKLPTIRFQLINYLEFERKIENPFLVRSRFFELRTEAILQHINLVKIETLFELLSFSDRLLQSAI